jgi:hypothetical protein
MPTTINTSDPNPSGESGVPAQTATTAATVFVVPVEGNLSVSASATLDVVQQLTVSMPYDEAYDIALSSTDSVKLMNAIKLGDASGHEFSAALAEGHELQAVLEKIINDAEDRADPKRKLADKLSDDMKATFTSYFGDSLPNILQSNYTFSSSVDAAGGATNLIGQLTPQACEIIAQQIPQGHYTEHSDPSENYVGTGLPLLDGDVLVFVFNVATGLNITRQPTEVAGSQPDNLAGTSENPNSSYTPDSSSYVYGSRRIAFFVTVQGVTPE